MKYILLSLLTVLFACEMWAQDQLQPLESNVVLETAEARRLMGTTSIATAFSRSTDCQNVDQSEFGQGEPIYCESGIPRQFCISTISFPEIDSLICYNCDALNAGAASVDANSFCITYEPDAGIQIDFSDTLQVGVCDEALDCQTLLFPMIIRRANNSFIAGPQSLETESILDLCIPALNLEGTEMQYQYLDCQENPIGFLSAPDSCFSYESSRFAGRDTICIEVCDEYCICDEYLFPVQVVGDTLSLPFLDDFSYAGPYPDSENWLDDEVFINSSLAYQPPTVGVATFDGVDQNGRPYGGGQGPADKLTSNYLDLSNVAPGDDLYLSFYAAAKGLGFSPGPADSLTLQFKTENGDWNSVWKAAVPFAYSLIQKIPFDTISSIEITNPVYLYNGFQFRFVNHSSNNGLIDLWHIDYVRVEKNQIPSAPFADIAFTEYPTGILKNYAEMPWRQFKGFQNSETKEMYNVALNNFLNFNFTIQSSSISLVELNNNVELSSGNTLVNSLTVPGLNSVEKMESFPSFDLEGAFSGEEQNLQLAIDYEIEVGEENPGAYPAVARNNNVRRTVNFGNTLTYDDGTAELAVKLENEGQAVAIEYDLNVADSLQGFTISIPRLGQVDGVAFRVLIYKDILGGDPIFTSSEYETIFADNFGPVIQGFITYKLRNEDGEPMALQQAPGKYFMVIEQKQNTQRVLIGLDLNNGEFSDKQYFFLDDSWAGLGIDGSLLLRPILGSQKPISTAAHEISESLSLDVFPNPANETLAWNKTDSNLTFALYDLYGRKIMQGANRGKMDISQLSNGTYYLQLVDPENGLSAVRIFQILH